MHPMACGIIHIRRLPAIIPTDMIGITSEIGVIQPIICILRYTHAGIIVPRVMLLATVRQLREHVVHGIISHIGGLVAVVDAAHISTGPIRVE